MVIGLADFAVGYAGTSRLHSGFKLGFSGRKRNGFYDYSQALDILPLYFPGSTISVSKLANVQSKTIFGGMENAGCIFYYENSVTGKRKEEALLAHEIAHQWFGNSVTENHWSHLWLSEGFATYLTDCYFEHKYGNDRLQAILRDQRKKVIELTKQQPDRPVVDTLERKYMNLLQCKQLSER